VPDAAILFLNLHVVKHAIMETAMAKHAIPRMVEQDAHTAVLQHARLLLFQAQNAAII
jgi:hypothetical protein